VEAGLDVRPLAGARLGITAFANSLDGAVANVTLARGPGNFPQVGFVSAVGVFRQRANLDSIRTRGIEVDGGVEIGRVTAQFSYAHADARVRGSGASAALDGLRPAQSPVDSLSATLGYSDARFDLSATVRHTASAFEDDQNLRRLPSATTLDAVARLRLGLERRLALVLRGENLTNTEVVSGIAANGVLDLAQPRTLWVGLAISG
jgi:outer membrane receptor protein involved in Fe transport